MNDPTPNILNLQLRALADIQRRLTELKSHAIRHENQIERLTRDVQEMKRKDSNG